MAAVAELTYYPVKGCAGTATGEALLTPAGLAHDRSFMVVDGNGSSRTQRTHPHVASITPGISPDGEWITLSAQGFGEVRVDVLTTGARRDVEMLGSPFKGIDQGDEVSGGRHPRVGQPLPTGAGGGQGHENAVVRQYPAGLRGEGARTGYLCCLEVLGRGTHRLAADPG
ncbi:MOSC domain-containing protein [Streptomyces sp. P17]|uniref:MOSC domain-containing protein n=1 Tax=Streptomyces sp. P17 TaxID=3074716 RepID=UPI0028F3E831|nr:MOSC domain-containing protein [Streptomyces sp. P17]MDT9698879.1 MOSC domain-containing protein [Streptomyces sp. P17]